MKKVIFGAFCAVALTACSGGTEVGEDSVDNGSTIELDTDEKKVSYFMGAEQLRGMRQQAPAMAAIFDVDAFIAGLRDASEGDSLRIGNEEGFALFREVQMRPFEEKKSAGLAFLAENAKKEGVVTLGSGLQYKIIKEGNGPKPVAANEVSVHYHGTLLDGTVFDSSVERGTPAGFGVTQVIAGWTEALQLMPVGSKWQLYIPYELAYGEQGTQGGPIGPFEALIFDVELLEITK